MSDLKNDKIIFRVPHDIKEKLQKQADRENKSLSLYVLELCESALKQDSNMLIPKENIALGFRIQTYINKYKCYHWSADKLIKKIEKEVYSNGNDFI